MSEKVKEIIMFAVIVVSVLTLVVISLINSKDETAQMVVAVHVKGEVNSPGYYELNYGSRVKDAIEAAGGATENADTNSINLAKKLIDGQEVIVIPFSDATKEDSEKININNANIKGFSSLPGIGEELAIRIVEYRVQNGIFESVEKLKNVPGISESVFEKIKNLITV